MMKVDHFPSPAKTPWVFNIELLLSSESHLDATVLGATEELQRGCLWA